MFISDVTLLSDEAAPAERWRYDGSISSGKILDSVLSSLFVVHSSSFVYFCETDYVLNT